jgi:DNA-binding transcriptional regulator YdaS (Cro superfamily)
MLFSVYLRNNEISDQDMALRLGVSPRHVEKIRLGSRKPSLTLASAIEKTTGGAVTLSDWNAPVRRENKVA